MAEDKGQGGAAAAIDDEEPAFEAPGARLGRRAARRRRPRDLDAMRHSTAHVMAEAVLDLFPGAKLGIGPAIDDGFYYDFDLPRPLTPADLEAIEDRMRESASPRTTRSSARRSRSTTGAGARGGAGPAVQGRDPRRPRPKAAGGRRAAAADELLRARPVQRPVPGPARRVDRQDRAVQAAVRRRRVLAGRREAADAPADLRHGLGDAGASSTSSCAGARRRRSATTAGWASQLDLFSFHDVRPGSAFWHPKGQRIWRTLEGAMRELQDRRGYQEVSTPIVVHRAPVAAVRATGTTTRENMFLVESEGQTFSLKPMNCPESTFIYRSKLRSYRDLPLRLSEFGRLHRNERSGALSGLTRVRQFIQDDAHIYVRPDQLDGRDPGAARRGPRGVRLVRPGAAVRVRDASPTRRSATRRCGSAPSG